MICGALRREVKGIPEWLVANGINMGRWTRIFGVNCLADTHDCQLFMANKYAEICSGPFADPKVTLHVFEVTEIT